MASLKTIKLKRVDLGSNSWSVLSTKLSHGEPLLVTKSGNSYITVGTNATADQNASAAPRIKAQPEAVVDNGTFFTSDGFDASRVSDIRGLTDDTPDMFYPRTIDDAVVCKKNSGGSSFSQTRTLSQRLNRIDTILGDTDEAIGTVTAQNGHHELRIDNIEKVLGTNNQGTGTGVSYVNSTLSTANANYYLVGVGSTGTQLYNARPTTRTQSNSGVYWNGASGALFGAAWNADFAELRQFKSRSNSIFYSLKDEPEPGSCVVEQGDGTVCLSFEPLQPAAYIVTDTFGMCIGAEGETPVAVAGKVLARVEGHPEDYKLGDCVCTSYLGRVRKMTKREIRKYPDRIVGTVIEVPTYAEWHDREVNNRIWIKVK